MKNLVRICALLKNISIFLIMVVAKQVYFLTVLRQNVEEKKKLNSHNFVSFWWIVVKFWYTPCQYLPNSRLKLWANWLNGLRDIINIVNTRNNSKFFIFFKKNYAIKDQNFINSFKNLTTFMPFLCLKALWRLQGY